MLLYFTTLALSLGFIFWSADRMLLNAIAMSISFRIPPLIIGAIIIGFGTSAPELVISVIAALNGSLPIAIGNAFGSNIANIALVLGTTAILIKISAKQSRIHQKLLIVLLASALPGLLLLDQYHLQRSDGIVLLLAFVLGIYLLVKTERKEVDPNSSKLKYTKKKHVGRKIVVFGMVLVGASQTAVWSALHIAQSLGISELIIGLTVIAIGTSLPELATALASAYRKQHTIALGNILGSNMFNSLAVIGLPVLIAPAQVPSAVLTRDYAVALGLTLLLWVLLLIPRHLSLGLIKGGLLLVCFIAYQVTLGLTAVT